MAEIDRLLEIMARLRDPESGCPWDTKQTFATIAAYTIEEAYEVADAIAHGNIDDLRDELGDLLLQVVFHAQMANEQGSFQFEDVARSINEKMIRRHPHVFADQIFSTTEEVNESWDAIKAAEKGGQGDSLMDGITLALPAATRAVKIQKKAAKAGFDWDDMAPVMDKIREELDEVQEEIDLASDHASVELELGDLLFACVNLARKLKVDPENALRRTNSKFETRFRYIEKALKAKGSSTEQATLEEMDVLWEQAKGKSG